MTRLERLALVAFVALICAPPPRRPPWLADAVADREAERPSFEWWEP